MLGIKVINESLKAPLVDGSIGVGFPLGRSPFKWFDFTSPIHQYAKEYDNMFTVYYNTSAKKGSKDAGKVIFGKKDSEFCGSEWMRPRTVWIQEPGWAFQIQG